MTDEKEKRLMLRIPADLHAAITARAARRLRSLNSEIIMLLKLGLVSQQNENEALDKANGLLRSKPEE